MIGAGSWLFLLPAFFSFDREVVIIDEKRIIRYSVQLAMLKQLLIKKLISEEEYKRILRRLKRDYGIVSNITT